MYKTLLLGLAGIAAADMTTFMEYCSKHGKSYTTMEEFQMRFDIFNKTDDKIKRHTQINGSQSFTLGHNQFSDLSEKEWEGMKGLKKMKRKRNNAPIKGTTLPASWDWRQHGAVTGVKN